MKSKKIISAAVQHIADRRSQGSDPRDILKSLVASYGATLTFPSYRTALRLGDIYTEAATSCGRATADLLLTGLAEKAAR